MTKPLFAALALLAAILGGPSGTTAQPAPAGGLGLGAVGVRLGPDAASIAVTIRNEGATPVAGIQVTAIRLGANATAAKRRSRYDRFRPRLRGRSRAADARRPPTLSDLSARRHGKHRRRDRPPSIHATRHRPHPALRPAPPTRAPRHGGAAQDVARKPYPPQKPEIHRPRERAALGRAERADRAARRSRASRRPSCSAAPRGDPGGINVHRRTLELGINGSTIAEPSGAVGGDIVFVTSNWYAAFSKNNGGSFTQLDPTTIFPQHADRLSAAIKSCSTCRASIGSCG